MVSTRSANGVSTAADRAMATAGSRSSGLPAPVHSTMRAQPAATTGEDAAAVDRRLGLEFQSGLPPEIRQQLQERGYQVESKRRYAPFLLDNGRPLVVPVEDTKIVPVSNRVY